MFVKYGGRFEKMFNIILNDFTLRIGNDNIKIYAIIINDGNIKLYTMSSSGAEKAYKALVDAYARGVRVVTIKEGGDWCENILPY